MPWRLWRARYHGLLSLSNRPDLRRFALDFGWILVGACLAAAAEGFFLLPGYDAGRNGIEWLYAFVLYGGVALLLGVVSSLAGASLLRRQPAWLASALGLWFVWSVVALYWMHQSPRVPAARSMLGILASVCVAAALLGVAAATTRWARRYSWGRWAGGLASAGFLLWAAAVLFVLRPSGSGVGRDEPRPDAPPVIVVLVDTLRRDHLPMFGYERETAPALGAFASDCLRFENSSSGGSRTVPSVATLFTGVHPSTHGVRTQQHSLNPALQTLPEIFRHAGYRTAAFVGNGTMRPDMGYGRGFDEYTPRPLPRVLARRKTAIELVLLKGVRYDRSPTVDRLVPAALEWIRRPQARPPFLYLHIMEPHSTYAPPADYARRFLREMPERDVSHPPRLRDGADAPWRSWEDLAEPVRLSAVETAAMEALYDGEILWVDHWLGRFFDSLRADGVYDDALIVFLSDHGEEFGDHDGWFHGRSLYEEMVGMPLLLKLPGSPMTGARELSLDTVDLLPTLCALTGIRPPDYLQGRSYGERLGSVSPEAPSYFVEEPPHLYALRAGRWKLIERRRGEEWEARLFDLLEDPGEEFDRAADHPDTLSPLREALRHLVASYEAAREGLGAEMGAAPSPDTQALLRSLGYVE